MLLKGYTVFSLLVAGCFCIAAINGWRMFAPMTPGVFYGGGNPSTSGGGHGAGGYHSTWHGGK